MESIDLSLIWSFGHLNLRLPRDFFHHYTLVEFFALRERYIEAKDYWPARIEATLRNINSSPDSEPIDFRDLIRTGKSKPKEPLVIPKLNSTPEELIACFGPDFDVASGGAR